jgi:hypothetical protein
LKFLNEIGVHLDVLIDFHVQNPKPLIAEECIFLVWFFNSSRRSNATRPEILCWVLLLHPTQPFPTHSDFIDRPKKPGRIRSGRLPPAGGSLKRQKPNAKAFVCVGFLESDELPLLGKSQAAETDKQPNEGRQT